MLHSMSICELQLAVHLGCSKEERAMPQEVRVNVDLRFHDAPTGCSSDDLQDTICYAKISEAMKDLTKDREFQLVEKLAADLYAVVTRMVERRAEVVLTVHKVRPPIDGLIGGVKFTVGHFA